MERRRLADAVRRLVEVIPRSATTDAVGADGASDSSTPPGASAVNDADVSEAADLVERAVRVMERDLPPWRPRLVVPEEREEYSAEHYFPYSPVVGPLNPLAPPIGFVVRDGIVCGTARFTAAYQGPPGCVHGGVIAQFFDELLGAANMAAGNGGLTGKLTIRYRSTTPLYTDLSFEGRSLPPRGRKVHAEGFLWAGDRLCAEAEGVFVIVDHDTFVDITVGSHPGR